MDDLISRSKVIQWVKTECNPFGKPTIDFESGKKVIEHLDILPSAQPEIIHCKDCIWHNKDINQCDRQICAVMYADDFCSYGERKGEQDG